MVYGGNYMRETNEAFMYKQALAYERGKPVTRSVLEYKRALLQRFADKLNASGSESVLEFGSGRGFNLLALAVLCPRLKILQGIDLTKEGVACARQNFNEPPFAILESLTGASRDAIKKRLAEVALSAVEGSITALPFDDGSFDAVFSNSVIEQIPRDYPSVFKEAHRVAKTIGIFSEPFAEAQGLNVFYRLYLKNIDYFCASYRVVEDAGWRITHFEIPQLQKAVFNTGVLTVLHA